MLECRWVSFVVCENGSMVSQCGEVVLMEERGIVGVGEIVKAPVVRILLLFPH